MSPSENKKGNDMLTWTSADGGLAVSVRFHRYDGDRAQYEYRIQSEAGGLDYQASDLRSGCGAPIDEVDMLRSLATFAGAFVESVEWRERTGRPGEHADLFPDACVEALRAYHDEFTSAVGAYEDA
jgi:hypothetical protein